MEPVDRFLQALPHWNRGLAQYGRTDLTGKKSANETRAQSGRRGIIAEMLSIVVYAGFSGGDLGNQYSVNEDGSFEDFHKDFRSFEEPPFLGSGLHQLVDHRQTSYTRAAALGS